MGEKVWDPSSVFDVFGDPLARQILVLASERDLSADELADELDVSPPTVYRRLNALVEYDLLKQHPQLDVKGNHYQTFETTLKRVTFEIDDGGINIDLQLRRSLTDQFDAFWSTLEESSSVGVGGPGDQSGSDARGSGTHHG